MLETIAGAKETVTESNLGPQFISPLAAFLASEAAAGITGQTFGVEGNHIFIYKMMTSHGATKRHTDAPWAVEEIGEAMNQIVSW